MSQDLNMRITPKSKIEEYKKIHKITYEIINSIRRVDLFIEPEVNDMFYEANKDILLRAMNRTDGNKYYEVSNLIDFNTGESVVVYGDRWHVPLSKNKDYLNLVTKSSYATLVLIHNHPNGRSFSAADIRTLMTTPALNIIVAVGNNGTVYTLTKSVADKDKILDYITNEAAKLPKQSNNLFWDNKIREDMIATRICNNYVQFGLYYTKTNARR